MTRPQNGTALGVVAVNSLDYVKQLIRALVAGQVTVPLRNIDDKERIALGQVNKIVVPSAGGGWLDQKLDAPADNLLAMLSFTSGTEGSPKAVYLSRRNLADTVERLNGIMGVTEKIREYVGVPVYHSFGYGRCRSVLQAGGQIFIPEKGFDLSEIQRMLVNGEINAISAVPSLWRVMFNQERMFGSELNAVKWVEIGSQAMSADEKRRLRDLMPHARIVQHYGLTEASRTSLLCIDAAREEELDSVGRSVGDVQIRIGDGGLIETRGPHVAIAIDDGTVWTPIDRDQWYRTGDLGHIRDGLLYFDGRVDDMINCAGIKLAPEALEAVLRRKFPEAGELAVLRCDDNLRGDGLLLALTEKALPFSESLVDALDQYTRGLGLSARGSIVVRRVDAPLPRTDTGKLKRKLLSERIRDADAAIVSQAVMEEPTNQAEVRFTDLLTQILGPHALEQGATFMTSGGDSLAQMQIQLALEQALGVIPRGWEALLLADLASRIEENHDFSSFTEPSNPAPPLPLGERNENPPDINIFSLIAEDYRTNDANVFHPGFIMLLIHRLGNARMSVKIRLIRAPLTILYRIANKAAQILFGMKLDYTVKVGRRVKLEHFGGMILGAREIGNDVVLRQNTTLGIRTTRDCNAKPTIGSYVDVGAGAVIVGDILIGNNSIIGANSVVYTDVPPNSVVMGVPARIVATNRQQNFQSAD